MIASTISGARKASRISPIEIGRATALSSGDSRRALPNSADGVERVLDLLGGQKLETRLVKPLDKTFVG
jgi:hypothetical protein